MTGKKTGIKIRYVVLAILLLIVIGAALFLRANWGLIQAAKIGLTTDLETINADREQMDKDMEASLGINGMVTEEMIAAAQKEFEESQGISASNEQSDPKESGEAAETPEQATDSSEGTAESSNAASSDSETAEQIVARYTAKLYAVRGSYMGRLNGLIDEAKAEYKALPKEERTKAAQASIISSKIAVGEALEGECDGVVAGILADLEAELNAIGASTAPVGQMRSYYESEKVSQKAAYLAMARGR